MASLYPKKIGGNTYWYLREMGRVDGRPKMISERYLGTAADITAALQDREARMLPERTRHLAFGDVAAVWGMLQRLGIVAIIDEVSGGRVPGAAASSGTYLAIAALNRLIDPCSKRKVAQWWTTTAADRFTRIGAPALDHRRFWDAMHAVTIEQLGEITHRIALAMIEEFGVDTSSVALDMTNFATFIDTGNAKAPIAQRGKAKQKRADLRLVGLGLVVTRDGGIPLSWHAYPGNRPDVTQFTTMIDVLAARHTAICAALGADSADAAQMTVVFDAGQNSIANFAHLAGSDLRYVGSVPAANCPDLLAVPAGELTPVPGYPGLSAYETRRGVYGTDRRVILTHSDQLHAHQVRGFEHTTLTKVIRRMDELAATLARGKTRRSKAQIQAEIEKITKDPWVRRVVAWTLTGDTPKARRLEWGIDTDAMQALETELFGKHVLLTDHDDWPIDQVVAAYRSQSEAEFSFRQLKDPHVVSFSPMRHWTDHTITVHTFTCVLALAIAHLMRRHAEHAGLGYSVCELLDQLAAIQETVLIYPSTGGRPKARRMLTDMNDDQSALFEIFGLDHWAPKS